jgi:SAM-dependent methyltransferase
VSDPSPGPEPAAGGLGQGRDEARYARFPEGFFDRYDEEPDERFYGPARIVTHIDDEAIAEVSLLYEELGVPDGEVLDLMSSWISHLPRRPPRLVALGMNAAELDSNEMAHSWVVVDLNADPRLPFPDESFDAVTCCVSVDYLTSPLEVFDEAARVLRPGGRFVCTFSNRCFPSKAIRGWLASDESGHVALVVEYFRRSLLTDAAGRPQPAWDAPVAQHRNPDAPGDPLYAVWATRRPISADP